jgi:hypothetical protein
LRIERPYRSHDTLEFRRFTAGATDRDGPCVAWPPQACTTLREIKAVREGSVQLGNPLAFEAPGQLGVSAGFQQTDLEFFCRDEAGSFRRPDGFGQPATAMVMVGALGKIDMKGLSNFDWPLRHPNVTSIIRFAADPVHVPDDYRID